MVFLKDFFKKVDFEKNQQTTKKHAKLPRRQGVKGLRVFRQAHWDFGTGYLLHNSKVILKHAHADPELGTWGPDPP